MNLSALDPYLEHYQRFAAINLERTSIMWATMTCARLLREAGIEEVIVV